MPNRPDTPAAPHAANPVRVPRGRALRATVRAYRDLTAPLAAGDHSAIASLRHLARSALVAWGITTERCDDVVLVLSELASNALLYTDGPARIHLRPRAGQLILDVSDTSACIPDLDAAPDAGAEHGLGLTRIALVLADSVTITPHPLCGKTITATFTLTQRAD